VTFKPTLSRKRIRAFSSSEQ